MAKHIDGWLVERAKEFSKVKVGEEKKPTGAVAVKREDTTYSEATFENMKEANPFLLDYTFEAV